MNEAGRVVEEEDVLGLVFAIDCARGGRGGEGGGGVTALGSGYK